MGKAADENGNRIKATETLLTRNGERNDILSVRSYCCTNEHPMLQGDCITTTDNTNIC